MYIKMFEYVAVHIHNIIMCSDILQGMHVREIVTLGTG